MLFITDKALSFVQSFSYPDLLSRIAMTKINYIYYKKDSLYKDIKARLAEKPNQLKDTYFLDNSEEEISRLVNLVHKQGRPAIKVRATLC